MKNRRPAGRASLGARAFVKTGKRLSHFNHRTSAKLADANIFHTRLNSDAGLAAVSFFDGSLQIVASTFGGQMYQIKDEEMNMPITSLVWRPNVSESFESQSLLGACLNGSIVRWDHSKGNSVEHIMLNQENRYHAIDYNAARPNSGLFVVAGTQPYIEIYDEESMARVQ